MKKEEEMKEKKQEKKSERKRKEKKYNKISTYVNLECMLIHAHGKDI